jgi:mono/diheme cytochrome c family protein
MKVLLRFALLPILIACCGISMVTAQTTAQTTARAITQTTTPEPPQALASQPSDNVTEETDTVAWQTHFTEQIRPILELHCFECHGEETQESNLRLDRIVDLRRGGDTGEPALLPGDPDRSHMIQLVTSSDDDLRMPPYGDGLSKDEIDRLRSWIESVPPWSQNQSTEVEGPAAGTHWSFQPIQPGRLPESDAGPTDGPADGAIDLYVLQGLDHLGRQLAAPADRGVLIRRLYLDLTGIPPSPDQVRAFVDDPSPQAYQRLVDILLADPGYGERWGRYWLDLVRFAETDGFETNRERPNAWPYRDYVIESLNRDKPYDQFLIEQLSGDLAGAPVATGYLVAGTRDIVKSPDVVLTRTQRQNELDDMINTTGTAMLGLTLGCARCHNHKFDPVTQRDYYAVQAIFAGVQHGEQLSIPFETDHSIIAAIENEISILEQELAPFRQPDASVRPAVTATGNSERFPAIPADRVRFTILESSSAEPCLDELQIFAGDSNVALSSRGSIASSSGDYQGNAKHQLAHINDGLIGNEHSWISDKSRGGWVQIDFPETVTIDRVFWSRDRTGQYSDRLAIRYSICVAVEGQPWIEVASDRDRQSVNPRDNAPAYDFSALSTVDRHLYQRHIARISELRDQLSKLLTPTAIYAGTFAQPEPTHRLFRGDPMAPREQVAPGTVAFLDDLGLSVDTPEAERRQQLARWIASPENPLTARVIVNRLWQHHFGRGLVSTPSDFGHAGTTPSHPELLDYLAARLIDSQWSLKRIQREILLSATYRQSNLPDADAVAADAGNEWLWRFAPRRLEAEAIRDSVLWASGVLDRRMGGPGFSAFEVELENVRHYHPKTTYTADDWRRMIYMTKVRQEQDAVFGIFDCPDGSTSVPARGRSTTPLQALNLLNSPFMIEQAKQFAGRLQRQQPGDVRLQIELAHWLCYGREATPKETESALSFIDQYGLHQFCRAMLNSNEFLFLP